MAGTSDPESIVPQSNGTGSGYWKLTSIASIATYDDMRTFLASANLAAALAGLGVATDYIWLPAKAWTPQSTNGCAAVADLEFTTGDDVMISYLAFDGATEEYAGISIVMPPTWDRGTVDAKFYWMPASGCTTGDTVEWQLQGMAASNDDNIDTTNYGNGQVISDTVLAGVENDLHITAALSSNTSAITISGTPALGDMINLKVSRNVGGTDDMVEDALLLGILLQFGISAKVTAW